MSNEVDIDIEVGTEWQHSHLDDYNYLVTVKAVIDRGQGDNIETIVIQDTDGEYFVFDRDTFLDFYEPRVREPKVGEVWKWKCSGEEFEILQSLDMRGLRRSQQLLVWYGRTKYGKNAGYKVYGIDDVVEDGEFVRLGPL